MNDMPILCLQCATVFVSKAEEVAACPHCASPTDVAEFQCLYSEASRVLMLGHMYRAVYEDQYAQEGEITSMYSLHDPESWCVFASIAALSGVIGNASYDIVKTVIKRLHAGRPDGCKQQDSLSASNNSIEVLVRHTKEFIGGMSEVNVVVRQCIEEEERADLVSKARSDAISQVREDSSPDEEAASVEQAVRMALQRIKSGQTSRINRARMQELLSNIWNELPHDS